MSQEPYLEIQNLSVRTEDGKFFHIRTFQTFPGVNYGIVGNTADIMLRILALLYQPLKGEVRINGEVLHPWKNASRYRGKITYVDDKVRLFSGTVKDNIEIVLRWQSLEQDQIEARLEELHDELRYGGMYRKEVSRLSREEYRIAQLLRAFALEPEVIVINDLSAYLSRPNLKKIEDYLSRNFRLGRSVIFSSSVQALLERLAHVTVTVHDEFITRVRTVSQQIRGERARTLQKRKRL